MLFMNGISAPGIGMAALAGRLPRYRHLLVDLPGHGLSPPYRWQGAPVRQQAVNIVAELLVGQLAVAFAGARGDLMMGVVSAPVLGGVATRGNAVPNASTVCAFDGARCVRRSCGAVGLE